MLSLRNNLFEVWLLLLPFSWVIAHYTGFTATDKLIAPLLMVAGLVAALVAAPKRSSSIFMFVLMASALLLAKNLSFVGSNEIYWRLMWGDAVKLGYFIIPLLCIDSLERFERASWIVTMVAVAGCISAFMVSVGLISLPLERFEESRLGIEGLPKAIGLFPSYGDLAQYISYAVLWVIVAAGGARENRFALGAARSVVAVAVVLGLVGTQSRNVLLTVMVSLVVLWGLRIVGNKERSTRTGIALLLSWLFVLGAVVAGQFAAELTETLAGIGGKYARTTAHARLEQYEFGWNLIKSSPILGADLKTYLLVGPSIDGIHNVWLRLAAQGGLVSVLALLFILVSSFRAMRGAASRSDTSEHAIVVTGYFAAMVVSGMFYGGMAEMFWALFGVATSLACIAPSTRRR